MAMHLIGRVRALFRPAAKPRALWPDARDIYELVERRWPGLTERQMRIVFAQADRHVVRVRNQEYRQKSPPPGRYSVADAVRDPTFEPILDVDEYDRKRALDDRIFVGVSMGR